MLIALFRKQWNLHHPQYQCPYREAELHALRVFDEVKEDYEHSRYVEAHGQAHAMLLALLEPSSSLQGALIKLKIASYFEGYPKDVEDPGCTVIAPRAVMSASRLHRLGAL